MVENNENKNIDKLIEMDHFDIFYRFGIVGFIIYFAPFCLVVIEVIRESMKVNTKFSFKLYVFSYVCAIAFAISIFAGHVLEAPTVSIYVSVSMLIVFLLLKKLIKFQILQLLKYL